MYVCICNYISTYKYILRYIYICHNGMSRSEGSMESTEPSSKSRMYRSDRTKFTPDLSHAFFAACTTPRATPQGAITILLYY